MARFIDRFTAFFLTLMVFFDVFFHNIDTDVQTGPYIRGLVQAPGAIIAKFFLAALDFARHIKHRVINALFYALEVYAVVLGHYFGYCIHLVIKFLEKHGLVNRSSVRRSKVKRSTVKRSKGT